MLLPPWVADPTLDEADRARGLLVFRIKAAALHIDPHCSVTKLSQFAGFSPNYLNTVIARGKLPRKAELAIRAAVGAKAFPTEEELLETSH